MSKWNTENGIVETLVAAAGANNGLLKLGSSGICSAYTIWDTSKWPDSDAREAAAQVLLDRWAGELDDMREVSEHRRNHAKNAFRPGASIKLEDADAVILTTNSVKKSGLPQRMTEAASSCGVKLAVTTTRDGYMKVWRMHKNIATWGVKWKSAWYRRRGHKVLYLENGLLKQKSGLYVDHAGYFSDSSIVTEAQPDPTQTEIAGMMAHCKSVFPWSWFEGGDPEGPIMVACQTHNDASVRWHHFPTGAASARDP